MSAATCRVRVRYSETDAMGVAHHTRHVAWFEVGRTELMRAVGLPYARIEADGIAFPVIALEARYRAPARYDEILEICTRVEKQTAARVVFEYTVSRVPGGELVATGRTEHATVDRSFRVRPLPRHIRETLAQGGERGPQEGPC